jgi:hypothetical protein
MWDPSKPMRRTINEFVSQKKNGTLTQIADLLVQTQQIIPASDRPPLLELESPKSFQFAC